MPHNNLRIGILGATGAVGREMLKVIHQRDLPYKSVRLMASSRSAGSFISFQNIKYPIEEVTEKIFEDIDICLASAGSSVSKKWAPIARKYKVVYIDNSSAFRLESDVPLVVPEVNANQLEKHSYIIGNPNCSTIQLVQVLNPLHNLFEIHKVIVSTYQAVSGAGKRGIDELNTQTKALVKHETLNVSHFPRQIAGNLIPHIDVFMENGYTREELKIALETRKILNCNDLLISATAVRVPVVYGHSEAVCLEFTESVSPDQVRDILIKIPNLEVLDDPKKEIYPTPLDILDNDNTLVGRIRQDSIGDKWISLWIVSNNLRKGAALNAVQIAEYIMANNLL